MNTKICTSIKQSKRLIELGIDANTADMWYSPYPNDVDWHNEPNIGKAELLLNQLPCWSLTALLEQLDDTITFDDGKEYFLSIYKEDSQYYLSYHDRWGARNAKDIETDYYDDLVDACVEMIIKLHELKLL